MNYLNNEKGFTLVELLISIFGLAVVLGGIALIVAIIKIAWHFIAKFW